MRDALEAVGLRPLMQRSSGRRDIAIGLIDGPVAFDHPDLQDNPIRAVPADGTRKRCLHRALPRRCREEHR
jgi:hypothetical protein